jgi:16S rRNA (guanine1207-N2)-methyltransferase
MDRLTVPQGEFDLDRYPADPRDQLRAWNAADEYLLSHVASLPTTGPTVVLNDSWGALAVALADLRPHLMSDSYLSRQATRANLDRNAIPVDSSRLLSDLEPPPRTIDLLLVRVPKSLAQLTDQLRRIAPNLHPGTAVVASGMVTEIHTSTLEAFERVIGPTRTSLAVKKARLIFCTPNPDLAPLGPAHPLTYQLPDGIGAMSGRSVLQYPGVFSAGRLDPGTRLLLQHLPSTLGPQRVVDLACGDGVLGLAAALANPAAELSFIDESHRAVASARANFEAITDRPARFAVTDGLADHEPASVDLVLNNPPFHSQHAQSDQTAWRMFADSRRSLRRGGELWVVGNRHLGYHAKLKRLFGNCEVVASNTKFVVLRAVRR